MFFRSVATLFVWFAGVLVLAVPGSVANQDLEAPEPKLLYRPDPVRSARAFDLESVVWAPSKIECIEVALLTGDPSKGMHHSYVKLSDGCSIAPHWHSTDEYVTVLSGSIWMGIGESFDRDNAERHDPGAFVFVPARTPHYGWADGDCVLSQTRSGAADLNWIETAAGEESKQ